MVQAGLKAIMADGWQVAADNNTAGDVYPDQSLYPCDSAPRCEADQSSPDACRPDRIGGRQRNQHYWFAPIVADAEAALVLAQRLTS